MGCEEFREALSARLDGESEPIDASLTDAHVSACPPCATWYDAAATVTRLSRLRPAQPPPTLAPETLATILAAAPAPSAPPGRRLDRSARNSAPDNVPDGPNAEKSGGRWVSGLWWGLGGLGAAQLLLGVAQIGSASADHWHVGAGGGVTAGHLWHESAAWNVAIGAAFLWISVRRTRPAGSLPILTAFLAVLALVSVGDALSGRVEWTRLASHGVLVAGYLILLALRRLGEEGTPPGARADGTRRWSVRFDAPADPAEGTAALLRFPAPPPATASADRRTAEQTRAA
ncbi:zf-HC2 domain-containing protein [Luedemannella flava]|uniref:Zf-HC2 domain-containing protein n=1 Tax=Luedemannella flava TaxID=349316 RepID=A0ABP4Y4T6_9ACTN